ncbi:TolC family protein [candidate division KSB1 bacterium]|nr:TolC family protein [candidate division KSB1 bacterium]
MSNNLFFKIYSALALLMISPFSASPDSTQALQYLLQEALQNNTALRAYHYAWKSAEANISPESTLPDPVLGFNLMNLPTNTYDFDQEPMTGKQLTVMQKVPFPGKLGLKHEIAREAALVKRYEYLEFRIQLLKQVKLIYYELLYLNKAIATVEKNEIVIRQLIEIAGTRYRTGKGLQQDVLRAQIELAGIKEKLITFKQQKLALTVQFNTLLNRSPDQRPDITGSFDEPAVEFDSLGLLSQAEKQRPLLQSSQAAMNQSAHKAKLARKAILPDFTLGIAYTQRDVLRNGAGGVDYLSGFISVNVPLFFWRKQNSEFQQSQLDQAAIKQRTESIRQELRADLTLAISELQKNHDLLGLYKTGIINLASQAFQSALAAYEVDKTDFLTVVNNQLNLINYELKYQRILCDYHKTMAELEAIIGIELNQSNRE